MLDTTDNIYNIDKKFDYSTVRGMVIQSLEKIVREEINRHIGRTYKEGKKDGKRRRK